MKKLSIWLILSLWIWLLVVPTFAQTGGVLTGQLVTRMRTGPGFQYTFVADIPSASSVDVSGVSADGHWLSVIYNGQAGWIMASALAAPLDSAALTVVTPPISTLPLPTNNCISIVGDSIPEGRLVFLVPGQGFPVIQTRPLADVLQEQLVQKGMGYIEVRNRSVGAANLSPLGKRPYQKTEAYLQLMQDNCRFIVMPGWNNDLNVERENGAEAYANDLRNYIRLIHSVSPHTHIVILTHYWGNPQDFVEGFGVGVTYENYLAHVQAVLDACQPEGNIGRLRNVTCVESQPFFDGMGTSFVVVETTQAQLTEMAWGEIPAEAQSFFNIYFGQNPGTTINGDGVHMSAAGKAVYVQNVLNHLLLVDPDL